MSDISSKDLASPLNPTSLSKPVRILHVVGGMNRAGVEMWLMNILRRIDRTQFQMDFLVHSNQHYAFTDEIKSLGSQIIPCPELSRPWLYAADFKRIIQQYGPYDIVHSHSHYFGGFVMWLAKQASIPIRIVHGHLDSSSYESHLSFSRSLYRSSMKWLISRYANHRIACSEQSALDLFGLSWHQGGIILPYGIDLAPFEQTIDANELRAELNIPDDVFTIGHVGRFDIQKNHTFLLDIVAEIVKKDPNIRLLAVGDGALRSDIEQKIDRLNLRDYVILTGVRSDTGQLMQNVMDVFLFPSLYEGLSLVTLDAQAAGLPCVFSDVVSEKADVVNSLMYRMSLTQSVSAWAEAVLSLRYKKLGVSKLDSLNAMKQSRFNIDNNVQELSDLYTSLIT